MDQPSSVSPGLVVALAVALTACQADIVIQDGTGGGTSTSATTGATTGATTSSSSTGGACAGFEDAPDQQKLTVRFHNDSGVPIYLPTVCSAPQFQIDAPGGSGVTYIYSPFCLQTCEDRQTQQPIDCAPCAPTSILLEPGKVREFEWNRTGLKSVTMPAGCYAGSPDSTCSQVVVAPAGDYLALATGYAECGDGATCTCDPATGVCTGGASGSQAFSDAGKFTLPSANTVDVTFGVCAFPCPNP
ncbi:MAG: hypothetical protein U0414_39065 [Polyangiaceae bacterium]